jgi:hypothetical protein
MFSTLDITWALVLICLLVPFFAGIAWVIGCYVGSAILGLLGRARTVTVAPRRTTTQ